MIQRLVTAIVAFTVLGLALVAAGFLVMIEVVGPWPVEAFFAR